MSRALLIKRASAILNYLMPHLNNWVDGDTLKKEVNQILNDSVDFETYSKAAFYLKNSMCPRGFDVHVSKTKRRFMLEEIETTSYMQRFAEQPDLKTGLGCILWDFLLSIRP